MSDEKPNGKSANPNDTESAKVLRLRFQIQGPDGRKTNVLHLQPGRVAWRVNPGNPYFIEVVFFRGEDSQGRPRADVHNVPLTSIEEEVSINVAQRSIIQPPPPSIITS